MMCTRCAMVLGIEHLSLSAHYDENDKVKPYQTKIELTVGTSPQYSGISLTVVDGMDNSDVVEDGTTVTTPKLPCVVLKTGRVSVTS